MAAVESEAAQESRGALESAEIVLPGETLAERQGHLAELDRQIHEELGATWNVRSVVTRDGALRVHTGMRVVDERVYRAMLPLVAIVYERDGGVPREVERIEVVNRFGVKGWSYDSARGVIELLRVPMARYEEEVGRATRELSGA